MFLPLHLIGWKIKSAIWLIIFASVFYVFQSAKTRAFEQGVASGKQSGWADAEKQQRAAWDEQWARIREDADRLVEVDKELKARRAELDKARAFIGLKLSAAVGEIAAQNIQDHHNAQTIDSEKLLPYIRSVLDSLRTIERDRATKPERSTAQRE